MLLFKEKTIGENKHHRLGFPELQNVVHHQSSMVPPQHREECSAERQMMNMSRGEEEEASSSSTKASLEKRCLNFIDSLRGFPWYKDYQNVLKEFILKEIDAAAMVEKMVELFQGQPELIAGFNQFLPEKYQITIPRVVCQKRKRRADSAGDSTDGVDDDDARPKASKIRKVIRCEQKTKERSCDEDEQSDDDDSTTDSDEDESTKSKLETVEKAIAFVNKVEERFRNNNDGASHVELFLDMVCQRSKSSSPNRSKEAVLEEELEIYKKVVTLLGDHHDLINEFTEFLTEVPKIDSIINFNKCKRGTPSYRLLPMNFPIPTATGRSKLASEVLNDRWICVDTGANTSSTTSRGGSRPPTRKSQHELDMFLWEEEMSDNTVWEENVNSALNTITALIEEMQSTNPPTKICIEKCRSHMSLIRCINELYGKRGCEMIDAVNKNNQMGLTVLLNRLEKKREELEVERSCINQKWAHLFPIEQRRRC